MGHSLSQMLLPSYSVINDGQPASAFTEEDAEAHASAELTELMQTGLPFEAPELLPLLESSVGDKWALIHGIFGDDVKGDILQQQFQSSSISGFVQAGVVRRTIGILVKFSSLTNTQPILSLQEQGTVRRCILCIDSLLKIFLKCFVLQRPTWYHALFLMGLCMMRFFHDEAQIEPNTLFARRELLAHAHELIEAFIRSRVYNIHSDEFPNPRLRESLMMWRGIGLVVVRHILTLQSSPIPTGGLTISETNVQLKQTALKYILVFRSILAEHTTQKAMEDWAYTSAACASDCLLGLIINKRTVPEHQHENSYEVPLAYKTIIRQSTVLSKCSPDGLNNRMAQLDVIHNLCELDMNADLVHAVALHHSISLSVTVMKEARESMNQPRMSPPIQHHDLLSWWRKTITAWTAMLKEANLLGVSALAKEAVHAKLLYLLEWWASATDIDQDGESPYKAISRLTRLLIWFNPRLTFDSGQYRHDCACRYGGNCDVKFFLLCEEAIASGPFNLFSIEYISAWER